MNLPNFFPISLAKHGPQINNIEAEIENELAGFGCRQGARIALAVGSRGIANIDTIVRSVVSLLRKKGAQPFIIPAMGSHGGGTAESQKAILEGYGITASSVCAPICSQMETRQVSVLYDELCVEMDRLAWESDGVILINRIKPHTNFLGIIGSGLQKMLAIGLGKMKGASIYHKVGRVKGLENIILEAAGCLIRTGKILGGLAILENSRHETAKVEWVPCESIQIREPELFKYACQWFAQLPFDRLHGLIVDQAGKEISGSGMDTNVIGRRMIGGLVEQIAGCPKIDAIYLRGLSKKSAGNCCGVGLADLGHKRLLEQTDPVVSRVNALVALDPAVVRMPMLFDNDFDAIQKMIMLMTCFSSSKQRTLWIRDTQSLDMMYASNALLEDCHKHNDIQILGKPRKLEFDVNRNIICDRGK